MMTYEKRNLRKTKKCRVSKGMFLFGTCRPTKSKYYKATTSRNSMLAEKKMKREKGVGVL